MKSEKIEVYFNIRDQKIIDFGMLCEPFRDGTIKLDRKLWEEYCKKRLDFELIHSDIMRKVPSKDKNKYRESMLKMLDECQRKIREHEKHEL